MPSNKRSSPVKPTDNKDIQKKRIRDLHVQYISTKENAYGETAYFKLLDKDVNEKLKIMDDVGDVKLPYWVTDDGSIMLSCKQKNMENIGNIDLVKNVKRIIDLDLVYYDFKTKNDEQLQGYTAQIYFTNDILIESNNNTEN